MVFSKPLSRKGVKFTKKHDACVHYTHTMKGTIVFYAIHAELGDEKKSMGSLFTCCSGLKHMRREIYCARGHFCHYLGALVARLSHLLLPPQVLHPRSRFCIKLGFTKVTITQSAVFLRLCLVPKNRCVR